MKKLSILLLALSLNAHAASFGMTTVLTSLDDFKMAEIILNDSQEYLQTGKISVLLADKINLLQSEDSEISESEAVDLIIGYYEQQ